jgi:alkanesulfonate monooxygenase SsuD/methylene tetrahydromethanopterin reductase-like flavin-dependent oxidoreductase (luciferase family)
MKFGAHYLPTYVPDLDGSVGEFYARMFAQIEELDRLGFDHAWITEHHFGEYGGTVPHPPTFIGAIARTTKRIRLGVAINVLPLHNPLDVAEAYAMADIISGGRLEFGVGKGSEPMEYQRLGVSQDEATVRMKEGMELILQAWSDRPVNFHGRCYSYENMRVLPKPAQRPHPPVWVGCARSEDSFQWAGEKGFHLMTLPYLYKSGDILPRLVKIYRESLAAAGRDAAAHDVLGKFHIYVSTSFERAVEEATPYLENYFNVHAAHDPDRQVVGQLALRDVRTQLAGGFAIAGDPERCIDAILKWRDEVGLTAISGTFHFGGLPQELALKNIRLFADKVMPRLR